MPRCLLRAAAALGFAALGALQAAPAAAQIELGQSGLTLTATPALATDYVFRGISQTRGRPAIQFTGDLAHGSGVYIGTFLSNVAFAGTDARQEIDALFGYRFALLTVLLTAFGRAVAEVGAVMIVGGNIDGVTRVMTTTIALETSKGDLPLALALGFILLAVVGVLNLLIGLMHRPLAGAGAEAMTAP